MRTEEKMKVTIAPDFRDLFRPLTKEEIEHATLNNLDDPKHERIPPVVVWKVSTDWIIVEGHHTHKIRENLRVNGKPVTIRYHKMDFPDRDSALAYAIRAQLGRRNLDASQIAMALAKLPKAKRGKKPSDEFPVNLPEIQTREELAAESGISSKTLGFADKVEATGAKPIKAAVAAGDVSVSDAAAIADLPKREQTAALAKVKRGEAKTLKEAASDDPKDHAKKTKALAHSYRDKLARAICDYHDIKPNRAERDRLVKLVQGIVLW